ncbi:unnamed protein product [Pylaiella littoralis]
MKCGSSSSIIIQTGVFVCCAVMCCANVGLPGATANLYAMFCGTSVDCLGSIWSGQPKKKRKAGKEVPLRLHRPILLHDRNRRSVKKRKKAV